MSLWTDIQAAAKKAAGQIIPGLSEAENAQVIGDLSSQLQGKSSAPAASSSSAAKATAGSGSALLTIGVELGAVGVFALIADSGDQAASIMLIVMLGLWILWAIQNSGVLSGFSNVLSNVAGGTA
jgi:hypothetical protein